MTTEEQFEQLGMEPHHARQLVEALRALVFVDPKSIDTAIDVIRRCSDFGPFVDPTFFVRNADANRIGQANRKLLEAALALRKLLPGMDGANG